METLQEAREYLKKNGDEGAICPCCNQLVKIYKRPIHANMAASLISLYKKSLEKDRYYHLTEFANTYNALGDFAKLRFWGLIEEKPKDSGDDKKSSGSWKITEKGSLFVLKQIAVLKKVVLQNNICYGFEGEMIDIEGVLKSKFSYREIMGDYYPNPVSPTASLF